MSIRLVSIVGSNPKKFMLGSWLIRKSLKTDYSHISILFWNSDANKPKYYEAVMHGGVKFTGKKVWESRNEIVFRQDFLIKENNYESFLDEAMEKCGLEYSFFKSFSIKLSSIFALSKNIFGKCLDQSSCSELVYAFREYAGVTIDKDGELVCPKDIVEACRERGLYAY